MYDLRFNNIVMTNTFALEARNCYKCCKPQKDIGALLDGECWILSKNP